MLNVRVSEPSFLLKEKKTWLVDVCRQ